MLLNVSINFAHSARRLGHVLETCYGFPCRMCVVAKEVVSEPPTRFLSLASSVGPCLDGAVEF